ncbi:MAG TPA: MFS transporter [Sporichthyaceae bacterium]|nr:MFS transporter [Sporichthyaceae bacterium]
MASVTVSTVRIGSRSAALKLSGPASFALLVSMAVTFLAAASAPTPLYGVYQGLWHFSSITSTEVFAVYALSVLGALLVGGRLSDHVGRRPVLLTAIGAQVIALVMFAGATGVDALFAARFIQGFSTGMAIGAMGAGMLDLDRIRGPRFNAVAPLVGTGVGSVVSGAFVQYLPAPTHLVYLVLLGVFTAQAVAIVLMPETVTRKPGALASLRPTFALPRALRGAVLAATPAMLAAWAMAGLYGSLGPALVHRVTGSGNHALGGSALFVLAVSGAALVMLAEDMTPRQLMLLGIAALFVGVGVTMLAANTSAVAFFLAAVVAGAGFGAAFQGALRTVVGLAAAHERAGVISVLFVVSYLAFGIPAVLAGLLVVHTGNMLTTMYIYGSAVMVLAAFAGVALLRQGARTRALEA